jgi:hypothetical protein
MNIYNISFYVITPAPSTSFCLPREIDNLPQPSGNQRKAATTFARAQRGLNRLLAVATACVLIVPTVLAIGPSPERSTLVLVERTVTQDQGTWVVDYWLRYTGQTGVIVTRQEIASRVEGWVSNSRLTSHSVPRQSSLIIARGLEPTAVSEVIAAVDESHRCRERLCISVWTEDHSESGRSLGGRGGVETRANSVLVPTSAESAVILPLSLGPDATVRVRFRLEHQHILYGNYDPLLAVRIIALTLGSATIRDVVPLDREQYLAQPKFIWPDPPKHRRDTRQAVSGLDSLHLEAYIPGHQYYRYPERPVRYNTKMRLRFWYLIAAGTEGECHVRVAQFKDTPTSWRILHNGGFEECLNTIGRWTKVEHVVQTEPEATTLTLEFKIVGEINVGEMWIDNVSLEPVGFALPIGP